MIELTHVTKQYVGAVTAVDDLSFVVQGGETFGLIGTSGCGKTTTLKMMNRLVEPTSGSIAIAGEPIGRQLPEQLRRRIGYVIQNVGLFPHYSVAENIAVTPKLLGWDPARIKRRTHELLDFVGLNPKQIGVRKPEALSGGQQQRVGLARALAADPPIILMDEPFGGVDPITKEQIQKKFKELLQQIDKTIVLVTHDVFEAFDFCDRVCLMDEGKVQQIGMLKELLFQPANRFVRSFFDEHRFQLEMMSITVKDIFDTTTDLKKAPPLKDHRSGESQSEASDHAIHLKDTFFSVFANIRSQDDVHRIYNSAGEMVGSLTTAELLEGFQTARNHLKNDHHA
jgi:osmoprotectant transport system ATP-binding protein